MDALGREWLDLIQSEYLDSYIRDGGAAVKFAVVTDDAYASELGGEITSRATEAGFLSVHVDASRVKVHMMHDLFFAVASSIPWRELARRAVIENYTRRGFRTGDDLTVEAVAKQNSVDPMVLHAEVRQSLDELLRRGDELAKDFRIAMLWMCIAETSGGVRTDAIVEWLQGELRLISALKSYLIFRKIGRHNARAMFASLGAWCRMAGMSGLVVTLDIRRLGIAKRADVPDGLYYTKAAVMDAYEVLRQLIDSTDDLTGTLSVVVAEPGLFDDDRRGVKLYKALYERVWPDVELREKANPLSSMTRLGKRTA